MSFLAEIRRRKVFQVAAVYAVVAWLLIQIVATIEAPLNLPDWFDTAVIVLLAIGFPITIVMSWAFNLTSEGLVRDHGEVATIPHGGRKTELTLLALLLIAAGWIVYRELNPVTVGNSVRLPNSVAVLPCANLSPNPDNDYFAASIHEEMLHQLAQIRALSVIARTSVLQFADAARPITDIAAELNVSSVMECSVSYAENRVAVNAQLIDGLTGLQLWSDRYYGALENVFEIQADIAMNIANELEAEFSPAEQARIERVETKSPAALQLYLKARGFPESWEADLDQAIRIDPGFASAYALKAYLTSRRLEGATADPTQMEALEPVVRQNAEHALELNPGLGIAYSALASANGAVGDLTKAQEAYKQALELSPNDPEILFSYARFERYLGRYEEAIRIGERSVDLNPNDPQHYVQLGFSQWYARAYDAAAATFAKASDLAPQYPVTHAWRGFVAVSRGNHKEAVDELLLAEQLWSEGSSPLRTAQVAFAYGQMGRAEDAVRFFHRLQELAEQRPIAEAVWALAYLAVENYEEAYQRLALAVGDPVAADQIALSELKANPYNFGLLEEGRWRTLRDQIGAL